MRHFHRRAFALVVSSAATFALFSTAHAAKSTFIAVLNAGQETPPPPSNAFGNAFMTFDKDTMQLCYAISYSALTSTEVAAHFHGPAGVGEDAPAIADVSPLPPGPSPLGSPKSGCVVLDAAGAKALKKGLVYLNIHSTDHSAGEIRGQVIPVKPKY